MSRETIRKALIIVALNDLEVKSGVIMNAYVQAPVPIWVPNLEKMLLRLGEAFRSHHARCKESMGYDFCKADLDL